MTVGALVGVASNALTTAGNSVAPAISDSWVAWAAVSAPSSAATVGSSVAAVVAASARAVALALP